MWCVCVCAPLLHVEKCGLLKKYFFPLRVQDCGRQTENKLLFHQKTLQKW